MCCLPPSTYHSPSLNPLTLSSSPAPSRRGQPNLSPKRLIYSLSFLPLITSQASSSLCQRCLYSKRCPLSACPLPLPYLLPSASLPLSNRYCQLQHLYRRHLSPASGMMNQALSCLCLTSLIHT